VHISLLGYLQRADPFSCLNLSDSVRLGRPSKQKKSGRPFALGVYPVVLPKKRREKIQPE
jgi:hypothetical protein